MSFDVAALRARFPPLASVDGVHYAPHTTVDLGALGADFFVCSPYTFFGPHCAVLAAAPELLRTPTGNLAERNVLAPAASFQAHEAFARLDVADTAGLRIGLAPYDDDEEIDRPVTALGDFLER